MNLERVAKLMSVLQSISTSSIPKLKISSAPKNALAQLQVTLFADLTSIDQTLWETESSLVTFTLQREGAGNIDDCPIEIDD
jgi:hypothetical protein